LIPLIHMNSVANLETFLDPFSNLKKQSSWIEYYPPQTLKIYVLIIVIIRDERVQHYLYLYLYLLTI